jgi:hypothetical protein
VLTFSVNNSRNNRTLVKLAGRNYNNLSSEGREWLSEVWFKALEGKIDAANVNIGAYAHKCEKNTKVATSKKETSLLTKEEADESRQGVLETYAYSSSNYESHKELGDTDDRLDSNKLAREFLDLYDYLLVEAQVDLLTVYELALEKNVRAIAKLKSLAEKYNFNELLKDILQNKFAGSIINSLIDEYELCV